MSKMGYPTVPVYTIIFLFKLGTFPRLIKKCAKFLELSFFIFTFAQKSGNDADVQRREDDYKSCGGGDWTLQCHRYFFRMIKQEEKQQLKDAICRLIDRGETSGLIDTVTFNPDLIKPSGKRRTWQVNIMKAIEIEMDL